MHDATRTIRFATSLAHRVYALTRTAYAFFVFVFLILFIWEGWFVLDLSYLGLPCFLILLLAAHIFLLFISGGTITRLVAFFRHGSPLAYYLDVLKLHNEEKITAVASADFSHTEEGNERLSSKETSSIEVGRRSLSLESIDSVELGFWGNLSIGTRALSRKDKISNSRDGIDMVLTLPFGALTLSDQKKLISCLQLVRPDIEKNKRLEKRLVGKLVQGEEFLKAAGALILCLVLLDLNISLFKHLEMLKQYHLAQVTARYSLSNGNIGNRNKAISKILSENRDSYGDVNSDWKQHFDRAEKLRTTIFPFSWVQNALLTKGFSASSMNLARAEALWYGGEKGPALLALEKALDSNSRSLSLHLTCARWLAALDETDESRKILEDARDAYEESVLVRLYLLLSLKDKSELTSFTDDYFNMLDREIFENEPCWPPGGNRFVVERWYRDDVNFIFRALVTKLNNRVSGERDISDGSQEASSSSDR